MIRFALVSLLLGGCTLPVGSRYTDVTFVTDEASVGRVEAVATKFRAAYPYRIEVVTDEADIPANWDVVRVTLVSPGFVGPGDTRPMCVDREDATTELIGLHTGDVWVCNDMSDAKVLRVLTHEMCHYFGAPGHPHWETTGGACAHGDSGELSPVEIERLNVIWKE